MGLLRRNIAQKVHQLQMVMEEQMNQKDFDKVSEKLEKIDEEFENPSLARNRLEIVKEFVEGKTQEFQELAKQSYRSSLASKLNLVQIEYVKDSLGITKQSFNPDDEIAAVFLERKQRHEIVFQNMIKLERKIATLDKQAEEVDSKLDVLLSRGKNRR